MLTNEKRRESHLLMRTPTDNKKGDKFIIPIVTCTP